MLIHRYIDIVLKVREYAYKIGTKPNLEIIESQIIIFTNSEDYTRRFKWLLLDGNYG